MLSGERARERSLKQSFFSAAVQGVFHCNFNLKRLTNLNLVVHITLIEPFLVCSKSAGPFLLCSFTTGLFMNPNNWLLQVSDGCSDGPLYVWWIQLRPGDQTGRSCSYIRSACGEPGSQNPAPCSVGSGQESVSSPNLDGAGRCWIFPAVVPVCPIVHAFAEWNSQTMKTPAKAEDADLKRRCGFIVSVERIFSRFKNTHLISTFYCHSCLSCFILSKKAISLLQIVCTTHLESHSGQAVHADMLDIKTADPCLPFRWPMYHLPCALRR